jgi:tetratricopeptide (TPR) repeat protein
MYGPMLYDWGYSTYYNPYVVAVSQPVVYDYTQPINPTAPAPESTVADQAVGLFDRGREAFRQGRYTEALDLDDQALRQLPNDPALHEFRALTLFALGRYSDASTALYPVLSIGPGWDWPTLIGLYEKPEDYTTQLRALEAHVTGHPDSASAHFLLAYHYLTQGHGEAALGQLRAASKLEPRDKLSSQLLQQLEKAKSEALGQKASADANPPAPADGGPALAAPRAVPAAEPLPAVAVKEGNLEGKWTAEPAPETTITLDLSQAGKFVWKVTDHGKDRQFDGVRTNGQGLLTLVQTGDDAQPPMVGKLSWTDDDHFTFKLAGAGAGDPGLSFSRSH